MHADFPRLLDSFPLLFASPSQNLGSDFNFRSPLARREGGGRERVRGSPPRCQNQTTRALYPPLSLPLSLSLHISLNLAAALSLPGLSAADSRTPRRGLGCPKFTPILATCPIKDADILSRLQTSCLLHEGLGPSIWKYGQWLMWSIFRLQNVTTHMISTPLSVLYYGGRGGQSVKSQM